LFKRWSAFHQRQLRRSNREIYFVNFAAKFNIASEDTSKLRNPFRAERLERAFRYSRITNEAIVLQNPPYTAPELLGHPAPC
jgi:hypothetical protein